MFYPSRGEGCLAVAGFSKSQIRKHRDAVLHNYMVRHLVSPMAERDAIQPRIEDQLRQWLKDHNNQLRAFNEDNGYLNVDAAFEELFPFRWYKRFDGILDDRGEFEMFAEVDVGRQSWDDPDRYRIEIMLLCAFMGNSTINLGHLEAKIFFN